MNNNELIITLIFAAVAAFVLFKLRSVLGRRTGHEQQRDMFSDSGTTSDNVVPMHDHGGHETIDIEPNSPVAAGVADIQAADPSFDPGEFIDGAKVAFEMIVSAFAKGARETLEPLLAKDVYASFDAAIAEREKAEHQMTLTFMGFKSAEIMQARMDGREARVTVKFVSEQTSAVTDAAGTVVEGDPKEVTDVTDVWTFARDTRSGDPNWQLVETDTSE